MAKSTYFFGQSVFGQLIDLIDPSVISRATRKTEADRHYKRFFLHDHLITMLFGVAAHCSSLREICGAMMGLCGKLNHFGMARVPRRSTLSDANRKRDSEVFAQIYYGLLNDYRPSLSDSQSFTVKGKKIVAIDSTTIALFKDILKAAGRRPISGQIKGGIKVHTELVLQERVPQLIWYSSGASNDVSFVQNRKFKKENIYVFDRGYIDYEFYEALNQQEVSFVTRLKDNASYKTVLEYDINEDAPDALLRDEKIELPIRKNGHVIRTVTLRRIAWWDEKLQRHFVFLSNIFDVQPDTIAGIYKHRWQIELLFKQLKQNFPLKYFLGDNENAITIQIWCALIANLLMTVIQERLKRKTAFSFIASFVRVNLINYIHLANFLNDPEKDWANEIKPDMQQSLFSS
jgi:hypothetical protein